jgi:hypothetical protein
VTEPDETLNRLIVAANIAGKGWSPSHPTKWDRTYARALVAELLRDMDEPLLDPPAIKGWDLAIIVIKRRAGIEVPDAD